MNQNQPHESHPIEIEINNRPVRLPSREVTGLQIKKAAIAQGVPIQLDCLLFLIKGNKQQPVKDNETIRVHPNEKFRCLAPDDNS